jgi:hypothetical protein
MSDEAHFHFSCYEEMFSILGSTQPPWASSASAP